MLTSFLRVRAATTGARARAAALLQAQQGARALSSTSVGAVSTAAVSDDEDDDAAMLSDLLSSQHRVAAELVPWMQNNMPKSYFRQCSRETRLNHLRAISALKGAGQEKPHMTLRNEIDEYHHDITIIRPGAYPGMLADLLVNELPPADGTLKNVGVFLSNDHTLALNVFQYGADTVQATPDHGLHILGYCEQLERAGNMDGLEYSDIFSQENMKDYLSRCHPNYVKRSTARRFLLQRELYEQVAGSDNVVCHWEAFPTKAEGTGLDRFWLTIAAGNVLPKLLLEKLTAYLNSKNMDAERVHLDVINDPQNDTLDWQGSVTMLRTVVECGSPEVEDKLHNDASFVRDISADIRRLKWLDDYTAALSLLPDGTDKEGGIVGVWRAEIMAALATMSLVPLSKVNSFAFNLPTILETAQEDLHRECGVDIANLFLARFDPAKTMSEEDQAAKAAEIAERIDGVGSRVARTLLQQMLRNAQHTLKTNLFMPDRYALSLRVNPVTLFTEDEKRPEVPYGVFFVHGRRFNGYHCRFRDIARGGVRIVAPPTHEAHSIEANRHFDECYNLAYAQQLKNKDIPEGGSKGVILSDLHTVSEMSRQYAMRKAFKAYGDSLLDLLVDTEETRANVVDYFGKPELLYLGPDERIIPQDINWIIARAARRQHPIPASFMSSKPDAGINHKDYGVTSEGVNVYLDVALQNVLGIDPRKDPFTVKITGGPDGDVAGNMMQILQRDYGDNARVVGVADATGCAEDPDGLNLDELVRLFHAEKGILHFNPERLGPNGKLYDASNEDGARMRNTMHNRVPSDAFVPGGGRPYTVNDDNWEQFMLKDGSGKPSSPLVVEGANIFFTDGARSRLFETGGVKFVKDSSANKCGVITSSYEIACSMLLSHDEFMDNKPKIVEDTLTNLRRFARNEAETLFREFGQYPGELPDFSKQISAQINRATDNITEHLADMTRGDDRWELLVPLLHDHFPKFIVDKWADRISERLPEQYVRQAIASNLAARMVYEQGIKFVEGLPDERLFSVAEAYVVKQRDVAKYVDAVMSSDLEDSAKEAVLSIVRRGGVRTLLSV